MMTCRPPLGMVLADLMAEGIPSAGPKMGPFGYPVWSTATRRIDARALTCSRMLARSLQPLQDSTRWCTHMSSRFPRWR